MYFAIACVALSRKQPSCGASFLETAMTLCAEFPRTWRPQGKQPLIRNSEIELFSVKPMHRCLYSSTFVAILPLVLLYATAFGSAAFLYTRRLRRIPSRLYSIKFNSTKQFGVVQCIIYDSTRFAYSCIRNSEFRLYIFFLYFL